MRTESRICIPLKKSIMGLQNKFLHNPSRPIGMDFGNNLMNYSHKTNRPKVLKINSPGFLQNESNEGGIKTSNPPTDSIAASVATIRVIVYGTK